jgi:hypothetical protein
MSSPAEPPKLRIRSCNFPQRYCSKGDEDENDGHRKCKKEEADLMHDMFSNI